MGKGSKAEQGKVSPVQVALIVDRHLSDNNYSKTLSLFRSEASPLISQAKGRQVPKSLLSLDAMLDEYICLKEQKFILDQEKSRVEMLLQGMQNVMQAYNVGGSACPPMVAMVTPAPQTGLRSELSTAGHPSYSTPASLAPMLPSSILESTNFSTPSANLSLNNKRKASWLVSNASPAVKKSSGQLTTDPVSTTKATGNGIPPKATKASTTCENVGQVSAVQQIYNAHAAVHGSSVAKSLFKQFHHLQTPCPKTPPQALASQTDKSVSPLESTSLVHSASSIISQEGTTHFHRNSLEKVGRSPLKHTSCYSMDPSHIISCSPPRLSQKRLNKRDHVKGKLDFNDQNMPSGIEKSVVEEVSNLENVDQMSEIFDIDLSTFDAFGRDFSLSELLVIDPETEEMCTSLQQAMDPHNELNSGSKHESGNEGSDTSQALPEPPCQA